MAAISRSDYRHFLYMNATTPRYLATQSWTPGTTWEKSVYSGTARYPIGTSFQTESATLRTEGPIDLGDMTYIFASIFPHRLAGTKWDFHWKETEAGTPAGYNPPAQYDKYLMYSRRAQCYEVASPIANSLTLTMRRQGESMMSVDWIGKAFNPVFTPTSTPTPSPVVTEKIIDNIEWRFRYVKGTANIDPNQLAVLGNVMEVEIMFPNLVEPLYTWGGSDFSWEDVAFRQTEPTLKVTMHADSEWVPLYDRIDDFLLEVSTVNSNFVFQMRGQTNSDAQVLQLAGDIQQSTMTFVPLATWAPGATGAWPANQYGIVEIDNSGISVIVAGVPGPPAVPTETSKTATQVIIGWSPPSNIGTSAITGYDVQYRQTGTAPWQAPTSLQDLAAALRTATITTLTTGTEYEFQVRAQNGEGEGAWSPSLTVTTN